MSLTPPSFDQAEFLPPPPPAPLEQSSDTTLLPAILFGLAGVLLGAIIYSSFIIVTHIQIGYLAIGVAYLVAKAMNLGSRGRGGLPHQIAAIVLTLLSIALGNAIMLWWALRPEGGVPLNVHNCIALLRFGFEQPFLEFKSSPAGALISLFILFIGLRAAWRMTSGEPGAVRHPFAR